MSQKIIYLLHVSFIIACITFIACIIYYCMYRLLLHVSLYIVYYLYLCISYKKKLNV